MGLCVSVLPITKGGRVKNAGVNQRQFFTNKKLAEEHGGEEGNLVFKMDGPK